MGAPGRNAAMRILKDGSRRDQWQHHDCRHHRCRPQRPLDRVLPGEGGTQAARARAARGGRRLRGQRGDRAGVHGSDAAPMRSGRCGRRSCATCSSPRAASEFVSPDPRLVALAPDGRALVFSSDLARTADAIRPFSDAGRDDVPGVLRGAGAPRRVPLAAARDDAAVARRPGAGEMWELLKTGRRFRALGRSDGFRLLRWMPMAAADLVAEWFATDLLQAAVAARGDLRRRAGPVVGRHRRGRCLLNAADRSRAGRQQRPRSRAAPAH